MNRGGGGYLDFVECVAGVYLQPGIDVSAVEREEKIKFGITFLYKRTYVYPGLFFYFADYRCLGIFAGIDEATNQVERAFGGLLTAYAYEHLAFLVRYHGYAGGGGVEVIYKPTTATFLRLEVMILKVVAPTYGAKAKFVEIAHSVIVYFLLMPQVSET